MSFRQSISFKKNELDFGNGLTYDGTIWTPYKDKSSPLHLLQTSNTPSLNYYTLCFFSTLKGEERKWLIALIIRDTSHFRSCIKEVITPSPLSPQFPHFPAFHSFSLSTLPLHLTKTTVWWYRSYRALEALDIWQFDMLNMVYILGKGSASLIRGEEKVILIQGKIYTESVKLSE